MKKIFISWDNDITESEADAIICGVNQMSVICRERKFVVYGANSWSSGSYSSGQWYVDHAQRTVTGQVDGDSLVDLLQSEPWQVTEPHIDVFFTSEDLTARDRGRYLNYCFGLADVVAGISVQSVARFRHLSVHERKLCIERVFRHEIGHLLGMASSGRANTEENLGSHCLNLGCTMRQGLNINQWLRHSLEENRYCSKFCPQCLTELHRNEAREKALASVVNVRYRLNRTRVSAIGV